MAPAARAASTAALLLLALAPFVLAQNEQGWQSGALGVLGYGSGYDASKGSCGYGTLPQTAWPAGAVAAIDPTASPFAEGTQQGCGVCIEVECTDASACGSASQPLVVMVTDTCTDCGADTVYLAPAAFGRLVAGSLGQVAGRFRRVNCNPPGGVTVHVDQYRTTQGGWLRLALGTVAGSGDIESIELAPSQSPGNWLPMQRTHGASWSLSSLPSPPFDLRATDASGSQVVARRVIQQVGQVGDFPTAVQFLPAQDLPTASAGASASAGATAKSVPILPSSTTVPPLFPSIPSPTLPPLLEPVTPRAPDLLTSRAPLPEAEPLPLPAAVPQPEVEALVAPTAQAEVVPPATETTRPTVQLVSGQQPAGAAFPLPSPTAPLFTAPPAPAAAVRPAGPAPTFFSFPTPTESTPTVLDTRPPRPAGVGPSITPAPVVFTPVSGLPTLPQLPLSAGPATRDEVRAAGNVNQATCSTLGDLLARIPQASNWTQLMRGVGLDILLRDKNAQVTLLVPVNSALNASMDARPLRNESTLAELVLNAPEIQNPLVGYHVLPGLWPTYTLQPGAKLNTSDTIDKVNRLQITAQGPSSLQGIGTSANILQGDIVACGASIIHIVDQVLLPFTFDQEAIDAVSGTTAPGTPRPESTAQPAGK